MSQLKDNHYAELEALAREEGIKLPMPIEMIIYFERQGKIVDLETGKVYDAITVEPTASGKAVAYLLAGVVGEVAIR